MTRASLAAFVVVGDIAVPPRLAADEAYQEQGVRTRAGLRR